MVATYALHYPEDYDGNDKFTGAPLAGDRKLNLNNLTFHLPFDKVEYEPEQFLVSSIDSTIQRLSV